MITMSSAAATLSIGLGTFLVANLLKPGTELFWLDVVILFFGIGFASTAITYFFRAYKVRKFLFPLDPDHYFVYDKTATGDYKSNRFQRDKDCRSMLDVDVYLKPRAEIDIKGLK